MLANEEEIIEENLILLLAYIYSRISWTKIKTTKNPWDIFNHRVRAASRKRNIQSFISKLCNYFGLQSLPSDTLIFLNTLKPLEEKALNLLFQEHIPICLKAIMKAKEMKEGKRD
ncbi:MAG: hypothetical protein DRP08_02255 [Candidatus Aenigmatarchaeota archaeon]|nr:MAG: hypothetical protein DRP08_02255 [Candidatus Aenigmarchaeota archaeon]